MRQKVSWLFALVILALMIGGPLWYRSYRNKQFRNFRVVEEGVLYRSGQLTQDELATILRKHHIKTVISLRDGEKPTDSQEESFLNGWGINFVRIARHEWSSAEGAEQGLKVFREAMRDPDNYPVLVHCFAGQHRTGAYCAVYRMDFCKWSNEEAMKEMRNLGYYTIDTDADLRDFLRNYRSKLYEPVAPPQSVSAP